MPPAGKVKAVQLSKLDANLKGNLKYQNGQTQNNTWQLDTRENIVSHKENIPELDLKGIGGQNSLSYLIQNHDCKENSK